MLQTIWRSTDYSNRSWPQRIRPGRNLEHLHRRMWKLFSDPCPTDASDGGPWVESEAGAGFQTESQQLPRPSAIAQVPGLKGVCGTANKVPTQSLWPRPLGTIFLRYPPAT